MPDDSKNIDLVFATHWVPAFEQDMAILTPDDIQCIKTRMEQSERGMIKAEISTVILRYIIDLIVTVFFDLDMICFLPVVHFCKII